MSIRLPQTRMTRKSNTAWIDLTTGSCVNVTENRDQTVVGPVTGTFSNSSLTITVCRVLNNGRRVQIGQVALKSFVLKTIASAESAKMIADSVIDPLADFIVEPGGVRGLINTAHSLILPTTMDR